MFAPSSGRGRELIVRYFNLAFVLARISLLTAIIPFAIGWRTPVFASWRYSALAVLIILPLLLIVLEVWLMRRAPAAQNGFTRANRGLSFVALALGVVVFGATAAIELTFRYKRHAVFTADAAQLEKLGAHLLVGYRQDTTLLALLDRRSIAGIFLSAHNVERKSIDAIRDRIDALQGTRRAQKLNPLWVATDQEGGAVSRMSPPLPRQPALAEIVRLHTDPAERARERQGRGLNSVGVNLNFAPVVDIDRGVVNPDDRLTRISSRAISTDPAVVTEVAGLYCATLLTTGVHCTLKHFPGLGRVYGDTHVVTAHLAADADELEASDWLPFRQLMATNGAFTMLSHARFTALDPEHPVSFSEPVVKGMLRDGWRHNGVLVTDDFGMGAVTLSRHGVAGGAVAALNAGVDLILVSYDPDQYFYIMYELLRADRDGRLRADALEASKRRLNDAAASRVISPAAVDRVQFRN
jgi:beta-N-acetylhexosaminidase